MSLQNRLNSPKLFIFFIVGLALLLAQTISYADKGGRDGHDHRHRHRHGHEQNHKNQLQPKKIRSFQHLKRLLAKKTIQNSGRLVMMSALESGAAVFADAASDGGFADHSDTNVQVAGVDEGDVVKTDGLYIYRIQGGKIQIVRARPANAMITMSTLTFDSSFSPIELYLNGTQLIVIGSGWQASTPDEPVPVTNTNGVARFALWAPSGESRTIARVYDVADRSNPVLQREIAFSGNYLSSRKIGTSVYLVGRKYPNYYFRLFADTPNAGSGLVMTPDNTLPTVSDSTTDNGDVHPLPIEAVSYFPGFVEPDYLMVAGFRLDLPGQAADIKAYLGGGDIVYASTNNLYLSAADYNFNTGVDLTTSNPVTHLYKFALNAGAINFNSTGEVPGVPLNQFSMDEHNGYFRIATTVDKWTQTGDTFTSETWNNLYTLDSDMAVVGRLEHLATGERLFAARFISDRAYLVTFQQIDPFFVVDLSIPNAPTVLGELKIPGFSQYLHPFDENHILGFGQDTENTETGVVTSGMKLALFDVTDVANPTQLHSLTIGEQGSYSNLLYDHKALWSDQARGLIGFPVSVTATKSGEEWPSEVFQGAYVYHVSLASGFQQKAAISHQETGVTYDWNHYIQRLLSIGNQLYTLSETRIQANNLVNFGLSGKLDFPLEQPPVDCVMPLGTEPATGVISSDCPILIDPIVVN